MIQKSEQLLTKKEAALLCRIGERTLERLMAAGKVRFYRFGSQVRFSKQQLLAMEETVSKPPDDPGMG